MAEPSKQTLISNSPQGWRIAAFYALQMVVCAVLILGGYEMAHGPSAMWAIVTAAVVLQPELKQSWSASFSRIAANIVGACVGLGVGYLLGDSHWQFILALVLAIFICERLGLEQSLRSACVTVTVIMLKYGDHLLSSGIERVVGVMIGCAVAIVVQFLTSFVSRRMVRASQSAGKVVVTTTPTSP